MIKDIEYIKLNTTDDDGMSVNLAEDLTIMLEKYTYIGVYSESAEHVEFICGQVESENA